jgi:2-polyprenyl-3-methyl-5-hydroxy-6-metoxy-1,4-benzoquinol methylase
MSSRCPICDSRQEFSFKAEVLKKYSVDYLLCAECGLLQTEDPYWLEEAYNNSINDSDTGLVSRNISISKKLSTLLYFCFDRKARYLDVAGGYGMLTRLMRDIGFDFYWHDVFSENLLAKGFEKCNATKPFEAITAFEVLEHVINPLEFIKDSLNDGGSSTFIFSTELFQGVPPQATKWWYYSLETGQHISFFQVKTLQTIAKVLSLRLYSKNNIHMLTDKNFRQQSFELITNERIAQIGSLYARVKMSSRTNSDHVAILKA